MALAGGCGGSSTKTVSVASAPEQSSTTATSSATTSARGSTTTTGTTSTGAAATRTASAPAFTRQGGSEASAQGAAAAAAATVRAHGYTPNDTSEYHPAQTLRVLVGTRTGSGDGYAQQAFFFLGNRYIGTDTSRPSASIRVVSQSDTEVTLAYPLYRAHDPLCCPGGGSATVQLPAEQRPLDAACSRSPRQAPQTGLSRQ